MKASARPSSIRNPRKTIGIAIGVIAVIVFGAGVAMFLLFFDYPFASARADQAAIAYRQAGLPWEAVDIQEVPPIRKEENAAPLILEAMAAFDRDRFSNECLDLNRLLYKGKYKEVLTRLAPHQKALALAAQASTRPRLDFGRDWDLGGFMQIPELSMQKSLVQAIGVRAQVQAGLGNIEAALHDLAVAQRLSQIISQESLYMAMLVRMGSEMGFLAALHECAYIWRSDPSALKKLQQILDQPQKPLDIRRAMMSDAYYMLATLRNMDIDNDDSPRPSTLQRTNLPKSMKGRAYTARFMQMWTEAKPVIDQHGDDVRKLGEELEKLEERWNGQVSATNANSTIMMPSGSGLWRRVYEVRARRAAIRALLQCLLFRIEKGRFPTTLTELKGTWTDPFTDRSLLLKVKGEELCVYSIGRNGVDDGGVKDAGGYLVKAEDDVSASLPPLRLKP